MQALTGITSRLDRVQSFLDDKIADTPLADRNDDEQRKEAEAEAAAAKRRRAAAASADAVKDELLGAVRDDDDEEDDLETDALKAENARLRREVRSLTTDLEAAERDGNTYRNDARDARKKLAALKRAQDDDDDSTKKAEASLKRDLADAQAGAAKASEIAKAARDAELKLRTALDEERRKAAQLTEELGDARDALLDAQSRAARADADAGAARREAGWRTLLEPKILRRLGVCVVLQFFQQFAGINAIVYFTPHILKSSGTVATLGSSLRLSADSAALLATAVTYFPKIPAMFLTMALMDTWGRAKMLRVFSPAMGLCLAALGLSLGSSSGVAATAALVAIALYGIFFNLSLGPVPNIYTAESFPARARSAAMTVSLCAQFLAHAMVSFWFPVLMASRGAPAVLYSFAGICGVAGLFACTLAETKQASLEAIASELD